MVTKKRSHARDFFMYLLTFVTLYISAISLWGVTSSLINNFVADAADRGYLSGEGLIVGISFLIVVYPIFFFMNRKVRAEVKKDKAFAQSGVRKWLTYITLFVTAMFLIGTAIGIVTQFFSGELATRFMLKAFAILIIAGGIFWFYMADVRDKGGKHSRQLFATVFTILVVLAVVTAFVQVGSPTQRRLARLDNLRVESLDQLTNCINSFYIEEGALPGSIDAMTQAASEKGFYCNRDGFMDPETDEQFGYQVLDERRFELCATFARADNEDEIRFFSYDWTHKAGEQCFEREIREVDGALRPVYR